MKLQKTREALKATQAQIAKEANISLTQYQNIEYDKNEPSVRKAIRIAKALNSTVEELWGGNQDDN